MQVQINIGSMKDFDPLRSEDAEVNKWLMMAFIRDAKDSLSAGILNPAYEEGLSALKKMHSVLLMDLDIEDDMRDYMAWSIKELDTLRKESRSLVTQVNVSCKVTKVRLLANTSPHCYLVRMPGSFYVEVYKKKPGEKYHEYEREVYMKTNSDLLGFEPDHSLVYIEMRQFFDVLNTVIPATNEKLRLSGS